MVANWLKALWIFLGATVAAVGAAYVTGVFEPAANMPKVEAAVEQPMAAAKLDQPAETAEAPAAADTPMVAADKAEPAGEQVAALEPQKEPAAIANAEPELVVPSFDLVRVEPDGSVVIAGRAAAKSMVEIISGATTIGSATVGDSGDFAIVLDDPLKAGDYTIVLRSTGEDKVVATSVQTAIISVPETESGQVLALVEEPGAPSRLITVPTAPKTEMAAKGDRPAAAEPAPEAVAAAEKAAPVPTEKPEQQAAAQEEAKPEQQAMAETPAEPKMEAMPEAEAKLEGEPATPEVMAKTEEMAPAPEQMAAAAEEPKADAPMAMAEKPVAAAAKIAVEAVEIEGRAVYVAGFAVPGSTVRVYANDILLGQAVASEAGRFLIEAEKDLPIGDYIVRADMLSKDKSEVLARAAVPFEREPGENVAAVAAPAPAASTAETVEKPVDMAAAVPAERPVEAAPAQPTPRPEQKVEANPTPRPADAAPKAEMAMTGKMDAGQKPEAMAAVEGQAGPMKMAAAPKAETAIVAEPATEPSESLSPKLQNVGGAVIIRRGDTLWRLSRRVYGRGVRYTTIYLANQEQISDPDRIWPGQVFSVPGETDEGEAADMSAVAEQTTEAEGVVTR